MLLALALVTSSTAAAEPLLKGPAGTPDTTLKSPCSDTLSAVICAAYNLLLGPDGLVPFVQREAAWAIWFLTHPGV
jgi:hypothetical protein